MRHAKLGSISHGTLRTEDLLSAFASELEWQIRRNGEFFSKPENFDHRDRLASLIDEVPNCFTLDGETIDPDHEDSASFLVNERGNCTLYVRENGQDREIWSVV